MTEIMYVFDVGWLVAFARALYNLLIVIAGLESKSFTAGRHPTTDSYTCIHIFFPRYQLKL